MNDEVPSAPEAMTGVKGVIASLQSAEAKGKAFWQDYKFYLVAFVILVVGMIAGYHLHR